jgi:Domain of unknown function (DUF4838)
MRASLILCFTLGAFAQPPAVLVENGQAKAVLEGNGPEAAELSRYIERATGVKLPAAGNLPVTVQVGCGPCPADVQARLRGLGRDGYVIESRPGSILLAGNGRDGTAFAIYDFLERYAGVRWLWPGDLGEIVPHAASLRVPPVSIATSPAFVWRNLGPGGALWGPLDKLTKEREFGITAEHQQIRNLWERHNRFGGEIVYGGHAMGTILPPEKYGPTHPEYFALVDGKRIWQDFDGKHGKQPCTTNPDVIRLTVEYCRRMFREHPEYDAVSISPNDGRGFCECDRCRKLDSGAMMNDRADPESGRGGPVRIISDRMITFANQVAEQVVKTNPGKKILLFAYGQYNRPPERVKANPAVIVQYTMRAASWVDAKAEAASSASLAGWSHAAPTAGIYEYFSQGSFADMPRVVPDLIGRSIRRMHELGIRYYQTQAGDEFALNGLNYYTLGRLLWDPQADVKAIEHDYVEKGFGRAAPAVARYYDRLAAAWNATDGSAGMNNPRLADYQSMRKAYPKSLRDACRADLAEAASLAESAGRDRVRFLETGFRYFEMTMDAIDKTQPLPEAGWKLGRTLTAPANPDMAAFERARSAWEDRARYVESHRDDFSLAYLWIRYNDLLRTFNPLEGMRAYSPH